MIGSTHSDGDGFATEFSRATDEMLRSKKLNQTINVDELEALVTEAQVELRQKDKELDLLKEEISLAKKEVFFEKEQHQQNVSKYQSIETDKAELEEEKQQLALKLYEVTEENNSLHEIVREVDESKAAHIEATSKLAKLEEEI